MLKLQKLVQGDLLLLDTALCFSSVSSQKEIPAAPVAVLAQIEHLASRPMEPRQLCQLSRHSRRRVQLCYFGPGHVELSAERQEELHDLVGLAPLCGADINRQQTGHVVIFWHNLQRLKLISVVKVHLRGV